MIVSVLALGGIAVVGMGAAFYWFAAEQPVSVEAEAVSHADLEIDVDIEPAAPRAIAPATAEFEFHHKRPGYQTSFYALGYVTNTSPYPIQKPEIIVVLKDENGNEVGTDNGFAADDVVPPGERSPCSILVKDPPPHASMEFEVAPRRATYEPALVDDLRIEIGVTKKGLVGEEIEGKVFNDGNTPARFVSIRVIGFDADDKIVGMHSTYAKTEVLAPGESARWKTLGMSFSSPPARLEYSVQARVAD